MRVHINHSSDLENRKDFRTGPGNRVDVRLARTSVNRFEHFGEIHLPSRASARILSFLPCHFRIFYDVQGDG